jgi:hypothetical protein
LKTETRCIGGLGGIPTLLEDGLRAGMNYTKAQFLSVTYVNNGVEEAKERIKNG